MIQFNGSQQMHNLMVVTYYFLSFWICYWMVPIKNDLHIFINDYSS